MPARLTANRPRASRRPGLLDEAGKWSGPDAGRELVALVALRLAELHGVLPDGQLRTAGWQTAMRAARRRLGSRMFDTPPSGPNHTQRRQALIDALYTTAAQAELQAHGPLILGTLHERALATTDRKCHGVFYTPAHIVEHMVERTLGAALRNGVLAPRVLDPACGCGAFLLAGYDDRLRWHANGLANSLSGRARILRDRVFGVDLDPAAVDVTRLSLTLMMMMANEPDADAPTVDTIRVGNSLIDEALPDAPHVQPFVWRKEFPAVFADGGFDAVIGNPPYINLKRGHLTVAEQAWFRRHYQSAAGQYDAFVLFMERALQLARPGGRHAFILPKPVLTNESYRPIRERLLRDQRIEHVIDCGAPFVGASVEAATIIACNEPAKSDDNVLLQRISPVPAQAVQQVGTIRQASLSSVPGGAFSYLLDDSGLAAIDAALQRHPPLGQLCNVFERGIEAGKNALTDSARSAGSHAVPTLRGDSVTAFRVAAASHWYAATPADSRKWKRRELYDVAEKLLIRRVASGPIAAVDTHRCWVLNTLYVVHPAAGVSCRFLAACINSSFFRWMFRALFLSDDRFFPYLRKSQLVSLPLPDPRQLPASVVRRIERADSTSAADAALAAVWGESDAARRPGNAV